MFKWVKKLLLKSCNEGYADLSMYGKGNVYDHQVTDFMLKHLKIWDWLNPYKVTEASIYAQIALINEELHGADPEKEWKDLYE